MLALMFHFSKHKINIKKIIVYSITLITTKSTTGYILYVLLLGSYFFKKQISLVKRVLLFIVFLSAVGGVVVYELSKSGYSVFQKFALTNISFMTRLSNIVVNYHIFLKSPLFGVGITSQMDLHHLLPQQLFNINTEGVDTNTFFSLFATFGVVYGMLSLIGTYKMVTLIAKSKIDKLLYFLIMFLALITENFRYSIFFYVLFWYGINAHKINEYPCFISKR
ncbi:O-antigen ligase family protein [Treponema vincentii]|uniref:O-antigen ligase family protein n=1 Tax=Treponema vincentii TaxID=69710 RepID=UPI0020A2D812|nr:O-antigen ligase family protein [Treponema vincentii]UTC48232.1 O-antigen ligase family protein [Treponema vincentii]